MPRDSRFDRTVPLPPGLEIGAIRRVVEYMERELSDLVEIYYEQMNVFSALVSIFGARALDAVSNYEKHRNTDTAQQRFPDLRRRGSGPNPSPDDSLESKGSKRPWAVQSHYDHPGWYIVWRYLIDTTKHWNPVGTWLSGELTSFYWNVKIGSISRVRLAHKVAAEPIRLGSEIPPADFVIGRFTVVLT